MLQQAVVFLLLVLGPTLPARSTSQQNRQYYEVDLPTEDFDEDLDDDDLGQSPWLEFASVQAPPYPQPPSPPDPEDAEHPQMTPEDAAAILARVTAAAHGRHLTSGTGAEDAQHSTVGLFTGTADMGLGLLGTASDAAAMQFMAMHGPADEDDLGRLNSAPPFLSVPFSPPAPPPMAVAPAPGEGAPQVAEAGDDSDLAAAHMRQQPVEPPSAGFSARTPPPAPPMVQAASPAPVAVDSAAEAQLPDIEVEGLEYPTPAPPFLAADAPAAPAAAPGLTTDQQEAQHEAEHESEQEGAISATLMGRGVWKSQKVSFPTNPQVPPAWNNIAPSSFCNPQLGLEPTDDGRCVCMQGFGTNADMRTCAKCPVGWYSRGGQVGIAYCKPCPQLSTSNPSRTACVARRNVIRPDVAKSMCEPCRIPTQPFAPPACCPRGQVCCGLQGCCPSKRCIRNATTGNQQRCCGDDCNIGQSLNCCPGGQVCVNVTGQNNQLCCLPNFVCGETNAKSCCSSLQECCGNRDCCNTAQTAIPRQQCAPNKLTGPPQNDRRCCLLNQVNCNGTCCTTGDTPPTQECLVDANGLALCCNRAALCTSASDGVTSCCTGTTTCVRNLTSAGLPISRCCPAGFSLCPKNNFQPICCQNGRCPSPSSSDNCLTS